MISNYFEYPKTQLLQVNNTDSYRYRYSVKFETMKKRTIKVDVLIQLCGQRPFQW